MKIYSYSPEMSVDRMYCPSTDEVIFAPDYEEINTNAEALIAMWHTYELSEPIIKDKKFLDAWERFYEGGFLMIEELEQFLSKYKNDEWIVYECTFYGIACGPVSETIYFVVKKDTIIEEDPNYYDEEAARDKLENTSEEEEKNGN